nr:hypothetical protein [Psychrobacter sp.]
MLYIILLLVVLFIGWSYIKARVRINEANKMQVMRKLNNMEKTGVFEGSYPSWMSNKNRIEEFLGMIVAGAKRRNVPEYFLNPVISDKEHMKKLILAAGAMEQQGSSFEEQAMFVSDIIIEAWNREKHS